MGWWLLRVLIVAVCVSHAIEPDDRQALPTSNDGPRREAVHGDNIERSNAHLPVHIQIQLLLVQIGVFSQVKLVLVLGNFVLSEVLTRRQLLLGCGFDHSLLLLQDRLSLRVRQLPDQLRQVVL